MKVTVHEIYDQAGSEVKYVGLGEFGNIRAIEFLDHHQEYRGGERYEHVAPEYDINFVWEMTDEQFESIQTEEQSPDMFGAVYFGNLLIEFRCAGGGYDPEYHIPIMDMYIYGTYDDIYEYNMNGVPYKFLDDVCLSIPNVRSKEEFQAEFEEEILDLLNERPELIKEAIKETEIAGWRK